MSVGPAFPSLSLSGMLQAVSATMRNQLQPTWLGGPPRDYVQVTGLAARAPLETLRSLCEDKELTVPVDSCWRMEDAMKVQSLCLVHPKGLTIYLNRRTISFCVGTRRVKSLWRSKALDQIEKKLDACDTIG